MKNVILLCCILSAIFIDILVFDITALELVWHVMIFILGGVSSIKLMEFLYEELITKG